ncbi:MAG: acyltransferase [Gammaproteobacteria bacterium]|nr:acyltransferase [Gammaproteobacteria bacterium]
MSDSPTNKKYIEHLHAFRGFAILTIVAAHSWSFLLFMGDFDTMPDKLVVFAVTETLFHGSTIYFAVISGLLFGLVLRDKGWKAFFRSKVLNVFTPYALVSLFFLSVFWPMYVQWFESEGMSTNFLVAYTNGLLTGKIMLPFWYIPILMMLYAATPVVDKVMHDERLRWLAGALVLLPLVISRTTAPDFLSVQTVVYFLGAYTLGMIAGTYYEKVPEFIRDFRLPLWIAAVGCSLVVLLLFLNEYEPSGQGSLLQTLVYVQKLSITALMIHYLSRNEESLPRVLFVLGSYAFAIYFLHFFVVSVVGYGLQELARGYANAWTAATGGLVILVAATSLSLLLSWLLKKLFRSKSRMIIGA